MGAPREAVSVTLGNGALAYVNDENELWIRDVKGRESLLACTQQQLKKRLLDIERLAIHLPESV